MLLLLLVFGVVVIVIVDIVIVVVDIDVAATVQTLWKFRGDFRTGSGLQSSFLEVSTRLLFRTTMGFLCPLPSHVSPSVVKTSEQPGPNSWTQFLFKTRVHWAGGRVSISAQWKESFSLLRDEIADGAATSALTKLFSD